MGQGLHCSLHSGPELIALQSVWGTVPDVEETRPPLGMKATCLEGVKRTALNMHLVQTRCTVLRGQYI